MKKNLHWIAKTGLYSIIAIALFSCNGNRKSDDDTLGYKIINQQSTTEDPDFYKIEIAFPFFTTDDTTKHKKLDILNTQIIGFLDTVARYYWGVNEKEVRFIKDETEASGIFELKNTYQILDTTSGFISIKMETYSYALGAHGFTAIHTYNYSIDDMKLLKLTDLINLSAPEHINLLNQLLLKHFENPGDCFNQQPSADEHFRLFALAGDSLVFFYEAYELGAYYCGMGTVAIPVSELKTAGLWKWNE